MRMNGISKSGFTLVELMVTVLIASVVLISIGAALVDAHRGYRTTFDRVYGDVTTQAYTSRINFDRICRKSSWYYVNTDGTGQWKDELYVHYYSDGNTTKATADPVPDRYAHFYTTEGNVLKMDQGPYDASSMSPYGTADSTEDLAVNATIAKFCQPPSSNSIQMILTLDDGRQGLTVTCSSVRHN